MDSKWHRNLPAAVAGLAIYEKWNPLKNDFETSLLPRIVAWAQEASYPLPVLKAHSSAGPVFVARRHIRSILANAFLLRDTSAFVQCPPSSGADVGTLDLTALYSHGRKDGVGPQRVACLLAYFHHCATEEDNGGTLQDNVGITINRLRIETPIEWNWETAKVIAPNVIRGSMEESTAPYFVDFANKRIHIHSVIASCTQEEILFSSCPELFVAILLCETLKDDEVLRIDGARRIIDYEGYGHSFRFKGLWRGGKASDVNILVIDAVNSDHFSIPSVDRDLGKLFCAFNSSVGDRRVVTGHLGCGAFGGDKTHKFLQQVCAASVAGLAGIDYSVFHDDALADFFEKIIVAITARDLSVSDIYRLVINYSASLSKPSWLSLLSVLFEMKPPPRATFAAYVSEQLGLLD